MRLFFRDENGQTLVFTAFLACCLMGFMSIAIDVGVLFRAQRKVQTAADAAAIAGTLEYFYHGSGNAATVAKAAAANNGITDTNQVTVNIPPSNGWHNGSSYLEVIIRQPNPTIFMGAFSALFPGGANSNYSSMTVAARAVGGIVPGQACMTLTDPSNPGSLTIKGGATVSTPHCVIQVDSKSPEALCVTGNNANAGFDSAGVLLVNAQQTSGNCNKLYPGAQSGSPSAGDPLGNSFTFPTPANVCAGHEVPATVTTITAATNLASYTGTSTSGGFMTNGASPSYNVTCFAGSNVTLSNVTLGDSSKNNLFLFEHGVVLSGTNTINGTMDLNDGVFCQGSWNSSSSKCSWSSAGGGPILTINAPANVLGGTQYAYNGMGFIMPSSDTASYCDSSYGGPNYSAGSLPNSCVQMQFGSGSGNLDGMIYTPGAALYMQDNGGGTVVTSIISDSLYVNSSLTITNNYNYAHTDSPLATVELVE